MAVPESGISIHEGRISLPRAVFVVIALTALRIVTAFELSKLIAAFTPEMLASRNAAFASVHVALVSAVDDGARRRETIFGIREPRISKAEHFSVHDEIPGFDVERNRAQRRCAALRDSSRQPDTATHDDRRRPPESWNRRLPDHIARLAPLERQAALGRDALAGRATEFRPVLRLSRDPEKREEEKNGGPGAHFSAHVNGLPDP